MKSIEKSTLQATSDVEFLKQEIRNLRLELEKAKLQIEYYQEQLRLSRQKRFGKSSDNVDEAQISFFNEAEMEAPMIAPEPKIEDVLPKRKRPKGRKAQITAQFEEEVIEYDLSEEEKTCSRCGKGLHYMKTVETTELTLIPASVKVTKHCRKVYACRNCEENGTEGTIVTAPMPKRPIENSLASPSLLAYIMNRKFNQALPLNRQEQEFSSKGILLSRQTMANWCINVSNKWLKPLYGHLHDLMRKREVLHADETVLEVLRMPGRDEPKDCYMWVYRTAGKHKPIILYEYGQGRSGLIPKAFLNGFHGYLMVDGYAGYNRLLEDGIRLSGCWAHSKRAYTDGLKSLNEEDRTKAINLHKGVQYCDRLFDIEREIADFEPDEKLYARKERSQKIVDEYFAWVKEMYPRTLSKSVLGKALAYSLNQEEKLRTFLEDGRLEISNNAAERSVKPFVIGRKNWLFANTPRGADASGVAYSIIETAKANGLEPFRYLNYLFEKLPNIDIQDSQALETLLPWSENLPTELQAKVNK